MQVNAVSGKPAAAALFQMTGLTHLLETEQPAVKFLGQAFLAFWHCQLDVIQSNDDWLAFGVIHLFEDSGYGDRMASICARYWLRSAMTLISPLRIEVPAG